MARLIQVLFAVVVVTTWACESKTPAKQSPQAPAADPCDEDTSLKLLAEVTYNDDIKEVIDDECLSCHATDGVEEPAMETWTEVKAAKAKIASSVADGSMPDGGSLTSAQKKLFADWKTGGYLEGDASSSDTKVTYDDDLKDLIEDKCISCHGADGPNDPPMDTWTAVKAKKSDIAASVADGSMPDGGTLTAAQKKIFADWKSDGYLEKNATSDDTTNDDDETDDTSDESEDDCP